MVLRKNSTEHDQRANNKIPFFSDLKGSPALASACLPKLFLNQLQLGLVNAFSFLSQTPKRLDPNELSMVVFTGHFPLYHFQSVEINPF